MDAPFNLNLQLMVIVTGPREGMLITGIQITHFYVHGYCDITVKQKMRETETVSLNWRDFHSQSLSWVRLLTSGLWSYSSCNSRWLAALALKLKYWFSSPVSSNYRSEKEAGWSKIVKRIPILARFMSSEVLIYIEEVPHACFVTAHVIKWGTAVAKTMVSVAELWGGGVANNPGPRIPGGPLLITTIFFFFF